MKTRLVLLALVSAFSLQPSALLGQGNLTPPGGPAPTMKTLDQVEARTPWTSAGAAINQPGSYYLTKNISTSLSSQHAIIIGTNNVTLDLNGFTISSTQPPGTDKAAIVILGNWANITILNGHIAGGVTNHSGTYNGPGFGYGIQASGTVRNVRVSGVSVSGCLYDGIALGATADSTLVESCMVQTVGGWGILASTIKSSTALDCGNSAIYGKTVSGCHGQSSDGCGIICDQVSGSCGESVADNGVFANTAQNCYGTSITAAGIRAGTAQNCYGTSSSSAGLDALWSAQNCYGTSLSGIGLLADTALNCYGHSPAGLAGLYAGNASFCTGSRSGGTAIQATVATGCYANSGTNSITYKYNMP